MAKPKFDPKVVADRTPSSSLAPLDFMRPMQPAELAPQPSAPAPPPSASTPQREDSRSMPPPKDDVYEAKTYRLRRHRHRQLKDEAFYTDQDIQAIVDTALGEYFDRRYGSDKA